MVLFYIYIYIYIYVFVVFFVPRIRGKWSTKLRTVKFCSIIPFTGIFTNQYQIHKKAAKALADWIKKMDLNPPLDLKNSGTRISVWDSPTIKEGIFFRRSVAPANFPHERPQKSLYELLEKAVEKKSKAVISNKAFFLR